MRQLSLAKKAFIIFGILCISFAFSKNSYAAEANYNNCNAELYFTDPQGNKIASDSIDINKNDIAGYNAVLVFKGSGCGAGGDNVNLYFFYSYKGNDQQLFGTCLKLSNGTVRSIPLVFDGSITAYHFYSALLKSNRNDGICYSADAVKTLKTTANIIEDGPSDTGTGGGSGSGTGTGGGNPAGGNQGSVGQAPDYNQIIGRFENPLNAQSIPELLVRLMRILLGLVAAVAVVVIIISGFRMVLSQGNPMALTKAKAAITWAIIGLIVSLMAFSIIAILQRLIQTN